MSYCKIGKFKPGDEIEFKGNRYSRIKVIGIKRRRQIDKSIYKLRSRTNNFSAYIDVIDRNYTVTLKHTLKNL